MKKITFWLIVFIVSCSLTAGYLAAQQTAQKTFKSPSEAVSSMIAAVRSGDMDQLRQIFGPQSQELLSSGDPVADTNDRNKILEKYQEMNRLVTEPDKSVTLYIGGENWPFPISLVNKKGAWMFDTAGGKQEVLFRRIGRNENFTIDTLRDLAEAQKEYSSQRRDGSNEKQYAQKIMSDEGKQNGLYWKTAEGQPQSPIGPLIAEAAKQGYAKKEEGPTPFHGYLYRMLFKQGKGAPGGAMDYMTNGKLTRGFAFVAYPSDYRNSGVMTFIVGEDGRVYQKDLGPRTSSLATSMTTFNPDKSWQVAE